jgi:hypothetical protein
VPASGSDSANAPIDCPLASFFSQLACSALEVPCSISSATSELVTTSETATVALACAIASIASA